jgi:acetamidase/formamidase
MAARILIVPLSVLLAHAVVAAQQTYRLDATPKTAVFGYYDPALPPVLRIHSGDIVAIHTYIAGGLPRLLDAGLKPEQVEPGLAAIDAALRPKKGDGNHFLTGPIFIESALPGDVLQIDIVDIRLAAPYAYNGFRPGGGTLPNEFNHVGGKLIWLDRERMTAAFAPGIVIPLKPFFGSIGLAPSTGRVSSGPPGSL